MKGKHLFLILALTISTTAVIALCGCSNAVAPASGAVNDPAGNTDNSLQTAAVSAQQPADTGCGAGSRKQRKRRDRADGSQKEKNDRHKSGSSLGGLQHARHPRGSRQTQKG